MIDFAIFVPSRCYQYLIKLIMCNIQVNPEYLLETQKDELWTIGYLFPLEIYIKTKNI